MNNTKKDEEVKNAILEASRLVFQKWGLNKTTMEDIAREAGKGKSTLYYYFKSKEEIFETLATNELNNMINKAKDSIANVKSPKEKLKKYIKTTLNEVKKTVSIYPLVRGEIKGNKEFLDRISNKLNARQEAIILEILTQGLNSGELSFLKKKELGKATAAIAGIIRGLALSIFMDNDDIETMDIATRLITEGI